MLLCCIPSWLAAFTPSVTIDVEGKWHDASPQDVHAVLDSVVTTMAPYLGTRTIDTIVVRNDNKGPISLYERGPNGEYIVLLDVQGRYWAQMVYQFSHEYCHVLSNYDLAPNNSTRQQWFEEALCEAFSLFTLEQMSIKWRTAPPHANWASYAPELKKYADVMRKEKHRQFLPTLGEWYRLHRSRLEDNPYAQDRKLNEKMAAHLLQIFEQQPKQWAAINYLNFGEPSSDVSLNKYLNDWLKYTPKHLQQPIHATKTLLKLDSV